MTDFKVGDRVRVSNPENEYFARPADYTVEGIEKDGTLVCGEASDDYAEQFVHPKDAVLLLFDSKSEAAKRKAQPIARGVLDYFSDALLAVAEVSRVGGEQHHPGQPIHWIFGASSDHADCLIRHLIDRGTLDTDGLSHTAKVAWRALALLQTELESKDAELHARREELRQKAAKGER